MGINTFFALVCGENNNKKKMKQNNKKKINYQNIQNISKKCSHIEFFINEANIIS